MKKIIAIIISLLMLLPLVACVNDTPDDGDVTTTAPVSDVSDEPTDSETQPAPQSPVSDAGYTLFDEDGAVFTIIRSESANSDAIAAAKELFETLAAISGVSPSIKNDYLYTGGTADGYEILVGSTNREESTAAKNTLTSVNQFTIAFTERKIVITGSNDYMSSLAVAYFIENYLTDGNIVKDGKNIMLTKTEAYTSDPDAYSFRALIAESSTLSSSSELKFTVAAMDKIKTSQGGCTDGTYNYQVLLQKDSTNGEKNNIVRIVKTDMKTGKKVAVSEDLSLNHANDLTYNPKRNELIVVHNAPYRKRISFVDPDTLTVTGTKDLSMNIYCISYNEKRDQYVVGLSGGQSFTILNSDFERVVSGSYSPTSRTEGYVTQGMETDDSYIYFVLYKSNVITVYDWSGKFVSLIELDVGNIEPENIFIYNDEIYVACGVNDDTFKGTKVYLITPKLKAES